MTGLMKGITLKIQKPGDSTWLDLSDKLSNYSAGRTIKYDAEFDTIDGEKIRIGKRERPLVQFTLLPCTGAELLEYYGFLRGSDGKVRLLYTDPLLATESTGYFWLNSDPFSDYMLKSVDGSVRYRIGELVYVGVLAGTYV